MIKKLLLLSLGVITVLAFTALGVSGTQDSNNLTRMSPLNASTETGAEHGLSQARGVVWDNGMSYDGLAASQYDPLIDPPLDPIVADDFSFAVDRVVRDVHWIGGYWNGPPDDADFDWEIRFYDDDGTGSRPGAVIAVHYFPNAQTNETFLSGAPGPEANYYSYDVDLPTEIVFLAGAKYWISIQGFGNYPPQSGWAYHQVPINFYPAVFKSNYFGYPDWVDGFEVFGYEFDMAFLLTDDQRCVWNVGDPFKMHDPQLPDEAGWDVNATDPVVLADDFLCTETGYIKDIHFWGSWRHNDIGQIIEFVLSLHSNIPEDQNPEGWWSKPGETLWEIFVPIEDVNVIQIDAATMEGWYDPSNGDEFPNDHSTYFQYNVCLNEAEWYFQHQDTIYWLNITAIVEDPAVTQWGWKNSQNHWMDDAVWSYWGEYFWEELFEPGVTLEPIVNDFWIEFDPNGFPIDGGGTDYYDDGTSFNGWYFYEESGWWNIWFYDHPFDPTRYKDIFVQFEWFPTDAQHFIEIAVNWSTDMWPPGLPPPIPPLGPGEEDMYIHREFIPIYEPGLVEFFVQVPEYNPEWVSIDIMGQNIVIPQGTITHECLPGGDSISLDLAFVITGEAPEEEPYDTVVCEPQGGNNGVHPPTYWYRVTPTIFGRCDFHVKVFDSIMDHYSNIVEPVNWTHQLQNVAGDWWFSWCNPGCTDAIFDTFTFAFDNQNQSVWSHWRTTADPDGMCDPYVWVIDSSENHTADADGYGYRVHVPHWVAPVNDWGDAPDGPFPTLAGSNGANHTTVAGVFLGATVDAEADGQPNFDASGDDINPAAGPDDEDGVVFPGLIVTGATAPVTVTASVNGLLNAWVDFNADGDWDEANEQIFTNTPLVAGPNFLSFIVAPGTSVGPTYARFRFDLTGGLSYDGPANDGEVEDYRIYIVPPVEDVKMHWPQWPDLTNTGMDVSILWWTLADDFRCTRSGLITDFHIWGSFFDDILPAGDPGNLVFHLGIYSDIPAAENPNGPWSQPGELLWDRYFYPGEFEVHQVAGDNPEDWFDPAAYYWHDDNHFDAYQYDFYVFEDSAFYQEEGTIYWLAVKDSMFMSPDYTFGWKTTTFDLRWNDDATWYVDPPSLWYSLVYPIGHVYGGESLDLAFAITGPEEEVTCGDANGSGAIDIDDVVYLISYIFAGGPPPVPYACVGDANGSGAIDIDDVVYLIAYIFSGGPAPVPGCCSPIW